LRGWVDGRSLIGIADHFSDCATGDHSAWLLWAWGYFCFYLFGVASLRDVRAGPTVSSAAWWMTIPPGLIITAILVVNNLRDLENDRKAGKHTLAVMCGERFAKIEYLVCMLVAYLVLPFVAWLGVISWLSLLAWGSLPIAFAPHGLCSRKRTLT
jgi:1,4-dihydroxy-2-naphthoate octaprenyltransferase